MSIACIDTNVLSYALLETKSTPDERLILRAKHLFKKLADEGTKIVIPTIVVGEFLLAIMDDDIKAQLLSSFQKDWRIIDYNLRAAAYFATISQQEITRSRKKALRQQDPNITRNELKADVMIIGTAIAYNANIIYSTDARLKTMAEDFITVQGLPDSNIQLPLLDE